MATKNCTLERYSSDYQVYFEYSYTQDPITAKSTLTHAVKLKLITGNRHFSGSMTLKYYVNGTEFAFSGNIDVTGKSAGYIVTIKSGTSTISHNSTTGSGNFTVLCTGNCNAGGYGPGTITLTEQTVDLPTIDRKAPSVSLSVSNITASSFTVTGSSTAECDVWEYSLNNGSSWTQYSTTAGTSAVKSITGLTPNTSYNVKVRARRKYNQVKGISSVLAVTTLGNSLLNSVNAVSADASTVTISMNWTVYANYSHTLIIKDGSASVLTITNLTCSIGTNVNKTVTLSDAQRTALLTYMQNKASFTATFELKTYSGSTQIGSTVSKTALVSTSAEKSAPIFNDFTHTDSRSETVSITGNSTVYIKNQSRLQIQPSTAMAQNEAVIDHYNVTIGSNTVPFTATPLNWGAIEQSGNIELIVSAVDSRGYETPIRQTIQVIDYENISITDYRIRRVNEVETTVQLSFSGNMSPITVENTAKNSIQSARFKYAKTGEGYSNWINLNVTDSSYSFSFETSALGSAEAVEFDSNYQYSLQIEVADKLTSDTVTLILNKGMPLVALRSKKVGINTPNPQEALDVVGNIAMNGFAVQGFVKCLTTEEDLNDLVNGGIYFQSMNGNTSFDRNYPALIAGVLEVFRTPWDYVLQRYTLFDCSGMYIRQLYHGTWGDWKSITLSS